MVETLRKLRTGIRDEVRPILIGLPAAHSQVENDREGGARGGVPANIKLSMFISLAFFVNFASVSRFPYTSFAVVVEVSPSCVYYYIVPTTSPMGKVRRYHWRRHVPTGKHHKLSHVIAASRSYCLLPARPLVHATYWESWAVGVGWVLDLVVFPPFISFLVVFPA